MNHEGYDFKKIKKVLLKNNWVTGFSAIVALLFLMVLLKIGNLTIPAGSLPIIREFNLALSLFSTTMLLFLAAMFIVSATLAYFEKYNLMFFPLILWLLVFTVQIRTANIPGLVDVATGESTLGPDLDPWLFQRQAQWIVEGRFENPDSMRFYPLGARSYTHTNLMPWAIATVYWAISHFNSEFTVTDAGIISPVIFFTISSIAFFFFVFLLFSYFLNKRDAGITSLIATALYVVAPSMLPRTIAGVPELESLGIMWFWLAFLFFALSWKQKEWKKMALFGALAGLATGAMMWTWGGNVYIFMAFSLATFLIFLIGKERSKNLVIFISWVTISLIAAFIGNPDIVNIITSIEDTGLALAILSILIIDQLLTKTKIGDYVRPLIEKAKLPQNIASIIIAMIIGSIGLLIIKPEFIINFLPGVFERLLRPFGTGRIGLTVAENRTPYFIEIFNSFGYLFWMFFFGTLVVFYNAVKHFDLKKKIWLNVFFALFITTFIFSRISPQHTLNGDNFISKTLYFGGLAVFAGFLIYTYVKAYRGKDKKTLDDFKKINFASILVLSLAFWAIVSMRGAIRLFFIIAPIIIIVASYVPIGIGEYFRRTKDKTGRIILLGVLILSCFVLLMTFVDYSAASSQSGKAMVPSPYNQQWQFAMSWVRENTPEDSVFLHWWDYGYWIQSIGERATVTDGGHQIDYWDHTTARYLLTAQNEKTALQLAKAHGATHFLIDSTDVGKYSAFASIGSDASGTDRLSWINYFRLNPSLTRETSNRTVLVYEGSSAVDEDLKINNEFYPMQRAGIGGFLVYIDQETEQIKRVEAAFSYNNQQEFIPIRYISVGGQITDLSPNYRSEEYVESMLYIIPALEGQGINQVGVGMYLSEKALSTQWVRLYLLNETEHFELVHSEDSSIIKQLKKQGFQGDIIYYQGFQGPLKIWKINIPDEIPYYEEYIQAKSAEGNWADLDYLGT